MLQLIITCPWNENTACNSSCRWVEQQLRRFVIDVGTDCTPCMCQTETTLKILYSAYSSRRIKISIRKSDGRCRCRTDAPCGPNCRSWFKHEITACWCYKYKVMSAYLSCICREMFVWAATRVGCGASLVSSHARLGNSAMHLRRLRTRLNPIM